MKQRFHFSASLALVFCAALSARTETIKLKTSQTLVELSRKWAQVYMTKHPEVKIEVGSEATATVFADLQDKKADLAITRHIKFKEAEACTKSLGKRPSEYQVAIDGVAVFVNKDNPVKDLTLDQLRDIFGGTVKNWKGVGGADVGITVYSPPGNLAVYESFSDQVLNGKNPGEGTLVLPDQAVLGKLSQDKAGIGYGTVTAIEGVRAVGIKRAPSSTPVLPSPATIVDQTYPISRYLYIYVNPTLDKDQIKAFVDWIRSDEGQKIAAESGFYSLPANLRSREEKR